METQIWEEAANLGSCFILIEMNETGSKNPQICKFVSSPIFICMWSMCALPCLWPPERTRREQRAAGQISRGRSVGRAQTLSRAEADSCSLSEVGTQRAFNRVSLWDWYTCLPSQTLACKHSHGKKHTASSPHLTSTFTTLPFSCCSHLQHLCRVQLGGHLPTIHRRIFRPLNSLLQREMQGGGRCLCGSCWVTRLWIHAEMLHIRPVELTGRCR